MLCIICIKFKNPHFTGLMGSFMHSLILLWTAGYDISPDVVSAGDIVDPCGLFEICSFVSLFLLRTKRMLCFLSNLLNLYVAL